MESIRKVEMLRKFDLKKADISGTCFLFELHRHPPPIIISEHLSVTYMHRKERYNACMGKSCCHLQLMSIIKKAK